MRRFLAACVAAAAYGAVLDRGRDEHVACATGRPASRARRHLVVATGHVRSIVHAASKLYEHVVAPTRSPVDVVFLVWHDAGYGCEERALAAARDRFNFTVLHDPRECDYFRHRGFHNMANQWWMVHRALGAALALQPGAPGGVDDRGAPGPELSAWAAGQEKRAIFPTSQAHISAVFHSFRLRFGRAIISRNGLEAWMLSPERARAKHSR